LNIQFSVSLPTEKDDAPISHSRVGLVLSVHGSTGTPGLESPYGTFWPTVASWIGIAFQHGTETRRIHHPVERNSTALPATQTSRRGQR